MQFKVSYYDEFYEDFLRYKSFDTLAAAQAEVSRLISPPKKYVGVTGDVIQWLIQWTDELDRYHEIRYDLTLDGWEMEQEC